LFDRYGLAEQPVINRHIDAQYRDFLAYPVVESDDTVAFHGKRYNETPRLLSDLQGDEHKRYSDLKDMAVAHYRAKADALRSEGKKHDAEFLEKSVMFVDDRFVYCYDGITVLGVWGMKRKENYHEDDGVIRKKFFERQKSSEPESEPEPKPQPVRYSVYFNAGENGSLNGNSSINKAENELIAYDEIPQIEPKEGFEFVGWSEEPYGYQVTGYKEFTAQYRAVSPPPPPPPPPPLPRWKRFWLWLCGLFAGRGCLKWLLWLLLLALLLWLLSWLIPYCCHGCTPDPVGGEVLDGGDAGWLENDPHIGHDGGIYDPYKPYNPIVTPPDLKDVLPPNEGFLPPVDDEPDVIPGNPSIIANRLNILMENEDKTIMDFAAEFKSQYPDDKYKVVYYDNVVKRMQIEIPKAEREQLKQEIPDRFAPEYELFVFDEALFEGQFIPNDPAFNDADKAWYLNAINAPQAWDITRGSDSITVAVIDNGFNLHHPELSDRVVMPYNVWLHSDKVFPQATDHGTHVAGTALAFADNGKGLCGIAPQCKFMPVQVANAQGLMTTTSVLDGILYALYQGADVINVSLGSQFVSLSQFSENEQKDLINNHFKEEERLWREIMRIAASHNATIVLAAGNDNVLAGIDAIQRPELFITVSATDRNNQNINKADFSNYGPYSTVSAPGVDIYNSTGKNDYAAMSGTSMAAPVVAGAVALMKSVNNDLTSKQIICILNNTGLPTQGNIGKLLQLDKALEMCKSGDTIDCRPEPTSGEVQILLGWNNYNDLDIICNDPDGNTIWFKNKRAPNGGFLEIDMNVEYPDSKNPIENIYWEPGAAPLGVYDVFLLYYRKNEPLIDKTPYKVTVKYGDKTEEYTGVIQQSDRVIRICSFTMGEPLNYAVNSQLSQLEQERERLQKELNRVENELNRLRNSR
jgi:subtilisin family serine protease